MPRLFIDIEARLAKFEQSLAQIRNSSEQTARSIESAFGGVRNVLGALGVAAGAGGLALHFKGMIDFADQLNTIHERTAIAVKDLVGLRFAAEQVDASFEDIQTAAKGLGKAISEAGTGNRDRQQLFKDLGMENARKGIGDVTESLLELAGVFPQFNQADQLRILRNLRIPVELAPLLRLGREELEKLIQTGQKVDKIFTDEFVKNADEFNDRMKVVNRIVAQTGASIVTELLPPVNEVLRAFEKGAVDGGGLTGGLEAAGDKLQELGGVFATSTGFLLKNAEAIGVVVLAFGALVGGRAIGAAVQGMTQWVAKTRESISSSIALGAQLRAEAATQAVIAANVQRIAVQRVAEAQAAVVAAAGTNNLAAAKLRLIAAENLSVASATRAAIAQRALAAATAASGAAATLASRALAFVGGPIGAVVTALTLGAIAWELFGNSAETAGEKAKKAAQDSEREVEDAIKRLEEGNLRDKTGNIFAPEIERRKAVIKALREEIDALRQDAAKFSSDGGVSLGSTPEESGTSVGNAAAFDAQRQIAPLEEEAARLEARLARLIKLSEEAAKKKPKPRKTLTEEGLPTALFEARLQDVQRGLAAEKRVFDENNTALQAAYDRGTIGLEQFVNDQDDILQSYVVNTRNKLEEQAALLREEIGKTTGGKDRLKLTQQLKEVLDAQTRLSDEAFFKSTANSDKARKEFLDIAKAVAEINAELQELQGNTARATEIRLQVRALELSPLTSRNPELAEAQKKAQQIQIGLARASEIERRASLRGQELRNAETDIGNQIERGSINEIAGMQKISDERQKAILDLEKLAVLYEDLSAKNPFNDQLRVQAQTFRVELERLKTEADLLRTKFEGIFAGSFSRGLQDLVAGKGLTAALDGFFTSISNQITGFVSDSLSKQLFSKEGLLGGIPEFFGSTFGEVAGAGGKQAEAAASQAVVAANNAAASAASSLTFALEAAATAANQFSSAQLNPNFSSSVQGPDARRLELRSLDAASSFDEAGFATLGDEAVDVADGLNDLDLSGLAEGLEIGTASTLATAAADQSATVAATGLALALNAATASATALAVALQAAAANAGAGASGIAGLLGSGAGMGFTSGFSGLPGLPYAKGGVFNHQIAPFAKGGVFTNTREVFNNQQRIIPFAKGGVFNTTTINNGDVFNSPSKKIVPFAKGDVFTSPKFFKFASGGQMNMGVMAEAGAEAILPLRRGRDGRLGVSAESGSSLNVVNNFHLAQPADARTQGQVAKLTGLAVARAMRRDA